MKAYAIQQTVTEQRPVEVPVVTLVLSIEAARAVRAVCGAVLGDIRNSPRKYTDEVYTALRNAGVGTDSELLDVMNRVIAFYDYPNS